MGEKFGRFLRDKIRSAGRQYETAKRAYREGSASTSTSLPRDEKGRARIVCRRYAERRAVALDDEGRPACFDADHQDCQGCLEDIRERRVETW